MNEDAKCSDGQDMTNAQKEKLRGLFEHHYEHALSDQDLFDIHFNLKRFLQLIKKAEAENL